MKKEKTLTPEELEFKRKSKNRLFILFVFLDVAMLVLIILQIISLVNK